MVEEEHLMLKERGLKKEELWMKIGEFQRNLDAIKGMVGAVGSRGMFDKFFNLYIKTYLPEKERGTSYTRSQLKAAYTKFLDDHDNPVALDLKKCFNGKTSEEIADIYIRLFGKISWYDHMLYESLLKTESCDGFVEMIRVIPGGTFAPEKKINVEKLVKVFIKHNEQWKEYNYRIEK